MGFVTGVSVILFVQDFRRMIKQKEEEQYWEIIKEDILQDKQKTERKRQAYYEEHGEYPF